MRVAHLANGFPELTQTFVLNQVRGLIDRGHDVRVVARRQPDIDATHELVSEYRLLDRTVYSPKPTSYPAALRCLVRSVADIGQRDPYCLLSVLSRTSFDKSIANRLSNVRCLLEQGSFDVYHAHFGTLGNSFRDIKTCRETPLVVSFYGTDASEALRKDPTRYDDLFGRVDAITVLSEDMRSTLVDAGCPRSKTHVQPLSIDTEQFTYRARQDDDGPVQLLTVARLVEKKGIEYALRAVAQLDHEYAIRYVVVGDGERREHLESLIAELGLEEIVDLRGWQPQSAVRDLMHESDLFVLPSVTAQSGDKEGTPTVLLEAQSSGLPVVSTYHAGIPEIVADGESGLLVPERDTDALTDALKTLLSSSERWSDMGRAGSTRMEQRHSISAASESLIDLYRSIQ